MVMAKKRAGKNKKSLKEHIRHHSRLTSLLIIKILLAFLSLGLGIIVYYFTQGLLGQLLALVLGLAVACVVYLVAMIKILYLLKF